MRTRAAILAGAAGFLGLGGCATDVETQLNLEPLADFEARIEADGVAMPAHAWLVAVASGDGVTRPGLVVEGYPEREGAVDVTTFFRSVVGAVVFTSDGTNLSASLSADELNPVYANMDAGQGTVSNFSLTLTSTMELTMQGTATLSDGMTIPFEAYGAAGSACAGEGTHGVAFETSDVELEFPIDGGQTLVIHCDGTGFHLR